uniref:J domain-containing protein n=1 Tax=Desulfatirhabdium butyrativorans TaxID=340467 RepID=A0A7C4W191_9BACT
MDIDKALDILHLPKTASPEEIKSAYRDMVRVWHPDRFGNDERLRQKAEEQLRLINEAHEALLQFTPKHLTDNTPSEESCVQAHAPSAAIEICGMSLWLIRMLARWIDLLLLVAVMGTAGWLRFFQPNLQHVLMLSFGASLLWVFVEANLISLIHTTPGKWLLGFFFEHRKGERSDLLLWLKRAFRVWIFGWGGGLWVTLPVSWGYVLKRKAGGFPLPWEFPERCLLMRHPVPFWRNWLGIAIALLLVTSMFLAARGNFVLSEQKGATSFQQPPSQNQPVVSISSSSKSVTVRPSPENVLKQSGTEQSLLQSGGGDGSYRRFMDSELLRCRDKLDCMPEHLPSRIKEALITDYDICSGSCGDLDRLPEGLRFFGVEQTAELVADIFRTIDSLNALRLGVVPSESMPLDATDRLQERLDTQLKTLSGKHFGSAQEPIDRFVLDYTRWSERFFLDRKEMLPAVVEAQRTRERQEAERRRQRMLQDQERQRSLRSGVRKPSNRAEAIEAFSPLDGMPIVWTPPLPPLADALLTPAYNVYGTLEGVEEVNGDIRYRVAHPFQGKPRYFLFYPSPSLQKRQFLTGEPIWMVGRLEGVVRFRTKAGNDRYMPLFSAEYIE